MKVCIIFTGGTIGSRVDENGRITTEGNSPYTLLEMYRNQYNDDIEFVVEEPYCILSENLAAAHIRKLVSCVNRMVKESGLDGIIITHGTDTLQYSAALLGYIFGAVQLPVILVSADFALSDERSNGLDNFRYALEFIKGKYGTGVFVSYCNKGDVPVIHRGTRIQQHLPLSADVVSIGNSWYGKFEDGRYIQNPEYVVRDGLPAMFEDTENINLSEFSDEIMRIIPYVGMPYPELSEHTRAVLHESFHSGTIAISEGLNEFADIAHRRNIPIFLTGLSEREAEYETVSCYRKAGIQPLCESAPIAQYCKLWLALSNRIEPDKIMHISVAEDFITMEGKEAGSV